MRTITLCGSVRFRDVFDLAERHFVSKGYTVLTCCWAFDESRISETSKLYLDAQHKSKIDLSDAILVIDVGGYVGESTKSEIEHARKNNKQVLFLSDLNLPWAKREMA